MMVRISIASTTAAAATTLGAPSTATGLLLANEDSLELDSLKSKLLTGPPEEIHRTLRRFICCPEFNANRLAEQVGEVLLHLPIQNKGDVGIELLLELKELLLAKFPRTGLEHRQDKDILTSIVGKGIQHAGSLDPRAGWWPVMGSQIFAEGNHT
jgi:hypothetical protein